jgi:hypothetical protein
VARGGHGQYRLPIPRGACHQSLRSAPPFDARFTNKINGAQFTSDGLGNYGMRPAPAVAADQNSSNAVTME